MPGSTILVVDDEPDIRETVREILADEGHQVIVAENAAAAREARRAAPPRRGPARRVDARYRRHQPAARVAARARRPALPGGDDRGHGAPSRPRSRPRLGAYDFIEKPISLAKLLLTLNRALEAGRLQRENEGLKRQLPPLPEPIGTSRAMAALKAQLCSPPAPTRRC